MTRSRKYLFVTGDKVYKIANQDLAALQTNAGLTVKISGELKGDTLTLSSVTPAK